MWTLGIRDKSLLCVISKILKSEIEGEGIPNKGTPQGGIISPLLSNIVLNELDWWIRANGKPTNLTESLLGI
jgi:RNA-directed DNA polymerase